MLEDDRCSYIPKYYHRRAIVSAAKSTFSRHTLLEGSEEDLCSRSTTSSPLLAASIAQQRPSLTQNKAALLRQELHFIKVRRHVI